MFLHMLQVFVFVFSPPSSPSFLSFTSSLPPSSPAASFVFHFTPLILSRVKQNVRELTFFLGLPRPEPADAPAEFTRRLRNIILLEIDRTLWSDGRCCWLHEFLLFVKVKINKQSVGVFFRKILSSYQVFMIDAAWRPQSARATRSCVVQRAVHAFVSSLNERLFYFVHFMAVVGVDGYSLRFQCYECHFFSFVYFSISSLVRSLFLSLYLSIYRLSIRISVSPLLCQYFYIPVEGSVFSPVPPTLWVPPPPRPF